MRFCKRKLLGLLSVAGLAMGLTFGGLLTSSAGAAPEVGPNNTGRNLPVSSGDTQTANVPLVAWDGEVVRVVWCSPNIEDPATLSTGETQTAHFRVHEWTGLNQDQQPQPDGADATNFVGGIFTPTSAAFFHPTSKSGMECVKADYKSDEAGLARISLNVYKNVPTSENIPGNRVLEASTDFLVIWLNANQPSIHETAASDLSGSNQTAVANFLGDPTGNGNFLPDSFINDSENVNNGLVQVKVTGTFPISGDPATAGYWEQPGAFPGGSVTLPADWATLASIPGLATAEDNASTNSPPFSNNGDPMLWDIHGTLGHPDTHQPGPGGTPSCNQPFTTATDGTSITDNCNGATGSTANPNNTGTGNAANGPFSRVFGDLTNDNAGTAGIGPFDTERGPATLLSDGLLNADDAPMPALQVNVSITPNHCVSNPNAADCKAGTSTDISGVGEINGANKQQIYSRDFAGSTTAHNLFNPYYNAYIPATANSVAESSGVDAPPQDNTGNFPGFLNQSNPYHFWDSVHTFASNVSMTTNCLRRNDQNTPDAGIRTNNYTTPGEETSIAVYTDERGEAFTTFSPETGFFFDSLINQNKSIVDSNGGCDLQSFNGKAIGTSSITAKPVYPFEPVSQITTASAALTKTVFSKWSKTLSAFPKGTGAQDANTRIFLAQAVDINGDPFVGETVCFEAQAKGASQPSVQVFTGTIQGAGISVNGQPTETPLGFGNDFVCATTDDHGLAAVEVTDTLGDTVDIFADFTNEKILRDVLYNYGTTPPPVINNVQGPQNGNTVTVLSAASTSGPGTSPVSTSSLSLAGINVSPARGAAVKGHIASARLVLKHGKYFLITRVNSKHKNAKIRIVYLARGGKTLRTFVRTVRTNRVVTINVPYSARVASIHVTLVG